MKKQTEVAKTQFYVNQMQRGIEIERKNNEYKEHIGWLLVAK